MTRGAWALAAAFLLLAAHASAEPTAAERETARTLLVSGRQKRKDGKLQEALADLERAHGIMRVPTTGLDLGKTQKQMGLLVEARATLLEAARYPTQAHEPQAFTKARLEASEIAEEIAPRLPTVTISVTPAGAKVMVDGKEISASSIGAPLKLNPGRHEILASLESAPDQHASLDLAEKDTKDIKLELHPTKAAAPSATPAEKPATSTADPTPPTADEKPKPANGGTSSLVWIGLATAGVGALVGTTTGIMALSVRSDLETNCFGGTKCPPNTHSDVESGQTLAAVSTIGFVVAAVGAVVLVTGLLGVGKPTATALSQGYYRW